MPVEGSEEQRPLSVSSPSAARTTGGTEEDGSAGRSPVCSLPENSQGSEATAAYPANAEPEEGSSGELYNYYIKTH